MTVKRDGKAVEGIYKTLHDRIISGFYPPGIKIIQSDLADELQVSRTPLREALNRLQANGLMVSTSNRGMEVAGTSFAETEQLYALRLLIEPPLIASLVDHFTQADLAEMEAKLVKMEESNYASQQFQDAHYSFHEIALKRYPTAVRELVEGIYLRIKRHQRISFSRPHVVDDYVNVDRIFLNSIRSKNAALARRILQFHLIDACLGMMFDQDPPHVPHSLLMAARGLGIVIGDRAEQISRPMSIRWNDPDNGEMMEIETINLHHDPGPKA